MADAVTAVATSEDREVRIRSILDDLLAQRRRMESAVTEPGLVDANRLAIVYWERQLSRCRLVEHAERSGT